MPIYSPPKPSPQLRAALLGAAPPSLGHSETSVGSDLARIRRGVRSESFLDVAILPAGALYTSTRGRPVRRVSRVYDANYGYREESALTLEVGNGQQNQVVIGSPSVVNAEAARKALSIPTGETELSIPTGSIEAPSTLNQAQPTSHNVQLGTSDEIVFDPQAQAQYSALISGGGYGTTYGALGASTTAQYQTIDESVPVYTPPSAPPVNYEPYYTPPAPTGTPQSYEEYAQVISELEQLELLNQGQFYWEGGV